MSALDTPDPDDPGAPVHAPVAGPPPQPDDVRRILEGVIDPELHASIVDLGMVDAVTVDGDGPATGWCTGAPGSSGLGGVSIGSFFMAVIKTA